MILDFRIKNFMIFSDEVEFSMCAEPGIEKFGFNVNSMDGRDVLKTACVYGANNSGKTCFVQAVESMTGVLSDKLKARKDLVDRVDIFSDDGICGLGVNFLYGGKEYSYDFRFAAKKDGVDKGFTYECFKRILSQGDEAREEVIFLRDIEKGEFLFPENNETADAMRRVSTENIFIYGIDANQYPAVSEYKRILSGFASGIDVVCMSDVDKASMSGIKLADDWYSPLMRKTLESLKKDVFMEKKIENFVKLADLDIDGFSYWKDEDGRSGAGTNRAGIMNKPPESDDVSETDVYRLMTRHRRRGKDVSEPSYRIDSVGTLKIMALSSYIIDALEKGRTLIVDELDAGLHFRLTRAIVLLFDNHKNDKGQLIFTTHDTALLDCRRLFREDQIWFVEKDSERAFMYSIADVDAEEAEEGHANRNDDAFNRYKYGEFGAVPHPDLIRLLEKEEEDGRNG